MLSYDFGSYYELFVAFNWAYVGSKGLKTFVNNKIFGLTRKRKTKIVTLNTRIETYKQRIEDKKESPEKIHSIHEAKRRLEKIQEYDDSCLDNIQKCLSVIYLIGGIYGLLLLYLNSWYDLLNIESLVNEIFIITFLFLITLSIILRIKKKKLNTFLVIIIYCAFVLLLIGLHSLGLFLNNKIFSGSFMIHFANALLVLPFILNFVLLSLYSWDIARDIKNAQKLIDDNVLYIYAYL